MFLLIPDIDRRSAWCYISSESIRGIMMDYYTVTQVAEIISKKRKTTAHAVRKVCERNGFGIKVNARLRLIPSSELQAIRSVIIATKYRSRVSRKSNRKSCRC